MQGTPDAEVGARSLRERIERLFRESEDEPRNTLELKDVLDRHGLWAEYRERFHELVSGDPWF